MKSIILIIPYFGKWPSWFELYLHSISKNPSVNFLFYTDCDIPKNLPSNIKMVAISFNDYIQLYKDKLDKEIRVDNPYRICDLRPFFGIIHENDIKGFDFFGWTDTDIIYGDIRSFYTNNILSKYNVLSTHPATISGHFALLANNRKYRNYGKNIYNWKKVLRQPNHVNMDERLLYFALRDSIFDKLADKFNWNKNNILFNAARKFKSRKYYLVEQYTTPFIKNKWIDGSVLSNHPDEWVYDNGKITNSRDKNRNFIYLHLMNFKSSKWRFDNSIAPWENRDNIYRVNDINKKIYIDKTGIHN